MEGLKNDSHELLGKIMRSFLFSHSYIKLTFQLWQTLKLRTEKK
jgi:hypothetical protein